MPETPATVIAENKIPHAPANLWRKRLLVLAVALLALPVLLFVAAAIVLRITSPFDEAKFNRDVWLQYRGSDDFTNPRGHMANDVQRQLKRGRFTRSEVIQLLGEPDFGVKNGCLQYQLGAWSGFRIDYDSLDVCFDRDGRVSTARIYQH